MHSFYHGFNSCSILAVIRIHYLFLVSSGGTNFGFMNGANIEHSQYRPDVTSYGQSINCYMYIIIVIHVQDS